MKKVLSLAAAGLMIVGMSSCKKDYTCECTTDFLGTPITTSGTINDTKKNAEEKCTEDNGAGITCEIK